MATYRPQNIALGQPLNADPGLRKLKENPVSRKALGNATQRKPLQQTKRQPLGSISLRHLESSQNIGGRGTQGKPQQERKTAVKKKVKRAREEPADGPIELINDRPWKPIPPPTEDDDAFATLLENIEANARNAGKKKQRGGGGTKAVIAKMQAKGLYESEDELLMGLDDIAASLSLPAAGDDDDLFDDLDFGELGPACEHYIDLGDI